MTSSVNSPCIGICSTVYGDDICRGCKRDYREVIAWNGYSCEQKQAILQRLEQQMARIVAGYITVKNPTLLNTQLMHVTLKPILYSNPLCWAYELLRLRAANINELELYGFQARIPYATLGPNALFTQMDDALYTLANKETIYDLTR